jgi:fructose-bisphosphate aldolase, class II
MALVSMKELLGGAEGDAYGLGMFDFYNLESLEAIFDAAEHLASPVIVGIVTPLLHRATIEQIVGLACSMARASSVPVAVHLDHGRQPEVVERVMNAGATSVMYDGSALPLGENIDNTRHVVQAARKLGVSTEAELGYVGTNHEEATSDDVSPSLFTRPEEAKLFVEQTGVDALAIAVGNAHGIYKKAPKLDFGLIERIRGQTTAHLVLHGASGIPPEDIQRAIALGIRKVNYFTEIACASHTLLRDKLAMCSAPVPFYSFLPDIRKVIQETVEICIRTVGSAGKAGRP